MQIPELIHVNIGNTTYILSHLPSSSTHVSSNSFLTTHPPPNSHGPSGRNTTTSHVHSNPVHTVLSQGHVPPSVSIGHVPSHGPSYGSNYGASHIPSYGPYYEQNYQSYGYGYQQPTYSPNYGFVAPHTQGTPHCNASMQPFMGHMGGGYYPTGQGHGVYRNQPYLNQSSQGVWHRPNQPRLPFLETLNLPDLSILMNDPVSHDPAWPTVPTNLPSNIPKFEGKVGEDPSEYVTTFYLWCSSNSLHNDSIHLRLFQCTLTKPIVKWYIELPRGNSFHSMT